MSNSTKLFLILIFTGCAILGFMIKLPRVFHYYDKELHACFYFFALLFLTALYPKKWTIISILLFGFGFAIEFAQEFSNQISLRLIGKKIHGNFDVLDIKYNLIGLMSGIVVFLLFRGIFMNNFNKT